MSRIIFSQPLSKNEMLICLGAGSSQLPLIQAAKEMGHSVLGIDRNSAGPGIRFLDEFINASTYDTNEVVRRLKVFEDRYKFRGLVARTSGPALKTAAAICETFQLPGLTTEIVPLVTEKSALREFCLQNQFPIAAGVRIKSYEEITGPLEIPVIVKPDLPLVGKKAVRVLFDLSQLEPAINEASHASGNSYVEVAQHIDGFDIACLFLAKAGKAEILAYWDELVAVRKDGTISGLGVSVPSVISETAVLGPVEQIIERFAQKFTRVNALLIMAFRIDPSGRGSIIELHGDLGGDLIADELFPAAARNFNYFQLCIAVATSSVRDIMPRNFEPGALLYHNDYFKNGSSDNQFSIHKAEDLGTLHESIQLLIKSSFFHNDEITKHLAFYRDHARTSRNPDRVQTPVRINQLEGLC